MKNEPKTNENEGQNTHWKTLEFDVETYQSLLDDDTISQSQKRELLQTLWNIIVQFVDLGFGVHPVQRAVENKDYHPAVRRMIEKATNNDDEPAKESERERSA